MYKIIGVVIVLTLACAQRNGVVTAKDNGSRLVSIRVAYFHVDSVLCYFVSRVRAAVHIFILFFPFPLSLSLFLRMCVSLSPFFFSPASLSPFLSFSLSTPYFIVSRALRPLKRPDYKRPINSFILFVLLPSSSPPFTPEIERRYSRPPSFSFFLFRYILLSRPPPSRPNVRAFYLSQPASRFRSRSSSLIGRLSSPFDVKEPL